MSLLTQQRCFLHADREAAARCPKCRRMFCRECVTEHGDRMLCAACLAAPVAANSAPRRGLLRALGSLLQAAVGLALCFLFFHELGRFLLNMPGTYHEGTLWRQAWNRLTSE